MFEYVPHDVFSQLFGPVSMFTTLSYLTQAFPRFTSPLSRVSMKHIFGGHIEEFGTKEDVSQVQKYVISGVNAVTLSVGSPLFAFCAAKYVQQAISLMQEGTLRPHASTKAPESSYFFGWRSCSPSTRKSDLSYPLQHISTKLVIFTKPEFKEAMRQTLPVSEKEIFTSVCPPFFAGTLTHLFCRTLNYLITCGINVQ